MKKTIFILTVGYQLLANGFTSKAQVNSLPIIGNKFTFGVDGGVALPSGDFATAFNGHGFSTTSGNLTGSANIGYHYDVYAGFKFSKIIGIMVQYGADNNGFKSSDLSNYTFPGG